MAEVIEWPGPLFSLAAFCSADFDRIVQRTGAKPDVSEVKSFGKVIDTSRQLFVRLGPRRCAAISKYESQPDFEIGLQLVGSTFYLRELELVRQFLGCEIDQIKRYDDFLSRWSDDPPTEKELKQWHAILEFEYPY